jgi:hypothetical protein
MDGQDRDHHHVGVGQDQGGLVGLERHRPQHGGQWGAAMPEPPRLVELEATAILLGVDHESPARADHQVIEVGRAAGDGQVVQDRPPLPLQRSQDAGGASLPRRSPPPGDGLRAGLEPQLPAGRHGRQRAKDQSKPGRQQAAEDSAGGPHPRDGGHPPGQGAGPDRPLARPLLPPPRLGRAT